jgi:6-pyruvoyltetrahydropterin/6-carboxytetrahydropterin synthase
MYELKIITRFSAAHQLKEFKGPCENLHGHNWKIEVCVTSETLDTTGLAIDFGILKKHVNGVVDMLDHKFLNDLEPFKAIKVSRVTAWESETACATYYA